MVATFDPARHHVGIVETDDQRLDALQAATADGDEAGAAWPVQPFVAACHEEVAPQRVERDVFDAKPMNSIKA